MNSINDYLSNPTPYYLVELCIHVDRPDLRDNSYRCREEHRQVNKWTYQSQGAAVCVFNEILNGEWDFSSEYVCWVQVHHIRPGKRSRCVRRRVDRQRPERWVYDHNPTPEGTRGWSLTDGTPFLRCETCGLYVDDGVACKHVLDAELDAYLALGSKGREILEARDA